MQPAADPEVVGVVDGGLGSKGDSFLVVLLDLRVLVLDMDRWGHPGGEHLGAEPAVGAVTAAIEDAPVEDGCHPGLDSAPGWNDSPGSGSAPTRSSRSRHRPWRVLPRIEASDDDDPEGRVDHAQVIWV